MPSEDEWAEADMTADEAAGKPLARTAEQGIKDMEARIRMLEARLNAGVGDATPLARELTEARQRLAEYRAQLEGRN